MEAIEMINNMDMTIENATSNKEVGQRRQPNVVMQNNNHSKKSNNIPLNKVDTPPTNDKTSQTKSIFEINKNNCFSDINNGPYEIIVQSTINNINKLQNTTIGKLIFNNLRFETYSVSNISTTGQNRLEIYLSNKLSVNNLLDCTTFQIQTTYELYERDSYR